LDSSLTLASNAPTVTPALQRHLDLHWALLRQAHDELDTTPGAAALAEAELAQLHTLYEEYEMNLNIDVPNDQVLLGHNFSPHGNVNFIAKGSVKQHQEDVKDVNHEHEPPQLKERSSSVNDLLGAFYTIRPRADRYHDLI